ncbi:hypothetical protein BS78_K296900 [Paspalum vaginatum]|uniref:Uncharacterized protein n=1 Tax=Paspalum vaginatum TaxID=158149 RepID=A0A9W8CEQ0_9POAL|nr:hypothetical protein BS78_K296900 [Paspalum vaginatum]
MASMQKRHEERAQSEAQKASDELHAARRDQAREEAPASPRGGGIVGSVQESARSVMGAVQDTFSGGRGGTNTNDSAGGDTMAATAGDYAEEGKAKARGVADAAMGKAAETKDAAADKARGAKEYAADKTTTKAGDARGGGSAEEDVMLRVKAADQMTGQAFNDVGVMGEEGTGMPTRRRSSG